MFLNFLNFIQLFSFRLSIFENDLIRFIYETINQKNFNTKSKFESLWSKHLFNYYVKIRRKNEN